MLAVWHYYNTVKVEVKVNSRLVTCDHVMMTSTVMPALLRRRLLLPQCYINTSPSTSPAWRPFHMVINACNIPAINVSSLLNNHLSRLSKTYMHAHLHI